MSSNVHIVSHPLAQHKLTLMRRARTPTGEFRQLAREIGMLMIYDITRDLPLMEQEIETPLAKMKGPMLAGKKLCFVPILRAGLGLVDSMLDLVPSARVGHIGIYRDPETLGAIEYYLKMPEDIAQRLVIVADPMLATGHSACAALRRLKDLGVENMKFACLVASPEGIAAIQSEHPDVAIYAVAIDEGLNDHAYILPGLGDAGDRLFGTK
ncbi:MAG: uracil phosphoribosyltransferase [Rhodospirillaceae bacterium]|nr:uracil phosphoribosyltransferase [Rhodospirillaceae bacterium]